MKLNIILCILLTFNLANIKAGTDEEAACCAALCTIPILCCLYCNSTTGNTICANSLTELNCNYKKCVNQAQYEFYNNLDNLIKKELEYDIYRHESLRMRKSFENALDECEKDKDSLVNKLKESSKQKTE